MMRTEYGLVLLYLSCRCALLLIRRRHVEQLLPEPEHICVMDQMATPGQGIVQGPLLHCLLSAYAWEMADHLQQQCIANLNRQTISGQHVTIRAQRWRAANDSRTIGNPVIVDRDIPMYEFDWKKN